MTWLIYLAVATLFYLLGFAHGNYRGYEAGMQTTFQVQHDMAYEMYEAIMKEARK